MEHSWTVLCERCRKNVPADDIKYVMKGEKKSALCSTCREVFTPEQPGASGAKKKDAAPSGKSRYVCKRCRFKFTFADNGATNLKCPYCGRGDKLIDADDRPVDKLLEESGRDDF